MSSRYRIKIIGGQTAFRSKVLVIDEAGNEVANLNSVVAGIDWHCAAGEDHGLATVTLKVLDVALEAHVELDQLIMQILRIKRGAKPDPEQENESYC